MLTRWPSRGSGLAVALAAAGALASAAVMWDSPWRTRPSRAELPGFTAEDTAGRLVVTSVRDGSGAERAGIAPGDVVETLDGRPVRRLRDAAQVLTQRPRRAPVRIGLVHAAKYHDVMLSKKEH